MSSLVQHKLQVSIQLMANKKQCTYQNYCFMLVYLYLSNFSFFGYVQRDLELRCNLPKYSYNLYFLDRGLILNHTITNANLQTGEEDIPMPNANQTVSIDLYDAGYFNKGFINLILCSLISTNYCFPPLLVLFLFLSQHMYIQG